MSGIVIVNPPPPPPPPKSLAEVNPDEWKAAWDSLWEQACIAVQAQTPLAVVPVVPVKPWWRSRLMWLGIATTAAGLVLEALTEEREIALQAFGSYGPAVIIGLGVTVKLLRWKTSAAIGRVPE